MCGLVSTQKKEEEENKSIGAHSVVAVARLSPYHETWGTLCHGFQGSAGKSLHSRNV